MSRETGTCDTATTTWHQENSYSQHRRQIQNWKGKRLSAWADIALSTTWPRIVSGLESWHLMQRTCSCWQPYFAWPWENNPGSTFPTTAHQGAEQGLELDYVLVYLCTPVLLVRSVFKQHHLRRVSASPTLSLLLTARSKSGASLNAKE